MESQGAINSNYRMNSGRNSNPLNRADSVSLLKKLTSNELLLRAKGLAGEERAVTVLLISHLAEIQSRRLFAEIGFSSMWEFCTKYLLLSEGAAQRRIQTMRLIEQLPQEKKESTKAAIARGQLSLVNAAAIQSFLQAKKKVGSKKNLSKIESGTDLKTESKTDLSKDSGLLEPECLTASDLIDQAKGMSQRDLQAKLFEISPELTPSEKVKIVSASKEHQLTFVVSDEVFQKLQQIKGHIAHKIPNATFAELTDYLATEVLLRLEQKKGSRIRIGEEPVSKNATSKIVTSKIVSSKIVSSKDVAGECGLTQKQAGKNSAVQLGLVGEASQQIAHSRPLERVETFLVTESQSRYSQPVIEPSKACLYPSISVLPSAATVAVATCEPQPIVCDSGSALFREPTRSPTSSCFENRGKRVYLSKHLRRKVFARAGGQCEYQYQGLRCRSQYSLEIDHRVPLALNGSNEHENLRTLCRQHNLQQQVEKIGIRRARS